MLKRVPPERYDQHQPLLFFFSSSSAPMVSSEKGCKKLNPNAEPYPPLMADRLLPLPPPPYAQHHQIFPLPFSLHQSHYQPGYYCPGQPIYPITVVGNDLKMMKQNMVPGLSGRLVLRNSYLSKPKSFSRVRAAPPMRLRRRTPWEPNKLPVLGCGKGAQKWVQKTQNRPEKFEPSEQPKLIKVTSNGGGGGGVIPFPSSVDQLQSSTPTTVMIKNIPNQFTRRDLLFILKKHCREVNQNGASKSDDHDPSEFDFVYLPMDFNKFWLKKRVANLGYAFVNFTTPVGAFRFYRKFHDTKWNVNNNNKICEITCAKIQGMDALKANFQSKIFWCHTEEYLPVVVSPPCDGSVYPKVNPVGKRGSKKARFEKWDGCLI